MPLAFSVLWLRAFGQTWILGDLLSEKRPRPGPPKTAIVVLVKDGAKVASR